MTPGPFCRFCGLAAFVDGRGPLREYPGWLAGNWWHARCEQETRKGGLD